MDGSYLVAGSHCADACRSPAPPASAPGLEHYRGVYVLTESVKRGDQRIDIERLEPAMLDEPLVSEEVEVERVPLGRWVEGPVPVRQEGDTTIITLLEEEVVVERRLRATEEIRITKRRSVERRNARVLGPVNGEHNGRHPRHYG